MREPSITALQVFVSVFALAGLTSILAPGGSVLWIILADICAISGLFSIVWLAADPLHRHNEKEADEIEAARRIRLVAHGTESIGVPGPSATPTDPPSDACA